MSDNRRFFVITRLGEVGPFTLEDLQEEILATRIARSDRLRTAFGANLGTVGDALDADAWQKEASFNRMLPVNNAPSPMNGLLRPPILAAGVGVLLVLGAGIALLMGRTEQPPGKLPGGSPAPSIPNQPAPLPHSPPPSIPSAPVVAVLPTPTQSRPSANNPVAALGAAFEHQRQNIPGIVELWRFDEGGENIGYHDTTPQNNGTAQVRPGTGVDLHIFQSEKNPGIFWIRNGEWLHYSCQVARAGRYRWRLLAARDSLHRADSVGLELRLDGRLVGTPITVFNTGSFNNFQPFTGVVTLPAGPLTLRLQFAGDDVSICDITFTEIDGPDR